jgi:hypothetical protein
MHVVLASQVDSQAAELVKALPGEAGLLVPADLSSPGWRLDPHDVARGTAVVAGQLLQCDEIDSVTTLLPRVFELELVHIVEADRKYVASEMTALLVAWLSALPCRVVNRPSPGCLCGPAWLADRWRYEAVRCGFRLAEAREVRGPTHTASVIDGECLASLDAAQAVALRRLAAAAGVGMLTAHLDSADKFVSVSLRPELGNASVVRAIACMLDGEGA